ncbi:MAG: flagellin [Rhodospirillales bacterium]|nr:flagellin [Rhodospirillales bacterium]
MAGNSSYGGTNLIEGTPDNLEVPFNEDGSSSVTINGTANDTTGLSITLSTASIDAALTQVRAAGESLGVNAGVLSIREEFTNNLVNNLEEGSAKLVQADLNEEAANALTAQTRGLLSVAATGIAAQSERSILQLF